jgi:membrane protein
VPASWGSSTLERARGAIDGYGRHACGELAAAIAYRILFSLVPFVALLAALLPEDARVDVVAWLLDAFPGATVEQGVEQQLASAGTPTSLTGLIAFGTLIWTASGMTRSLRVALAVVWEVDARPAFVRAKLRDIAALGVLAALVLGVFALSLATQIAVQAGAGITDALGLGRAAGVLTRVTELAVTAGATFAALLIVYRLAAPVATPLGRVWLSALVTAVAIDVGVAGYAFYLVQIASFDTIYGPLGAVLAFLALLYIAAVLVLFGAELIVAGPRRRVIHSG